MLINTLWQVGAFVSPYRFGLAKDATGGFKLGLIGSAVVAGVEALPILYVRFGSRPIAKCASALLLGP